MPITSPIAFPRLSTEEFGSLDYNIMPLAFACHKEVGRLADEAIYQADFAARLVEAGYEVQREIPVTATFRDFSKTYFLDAVVAGKAVYELKVVSKLNAEHEAQLMNYLLLANATRGKLINFRPASVESRFVNAPVTLEQRKAFTVDAQHWQGGTIAVDLMVELLRDWGTCLEIPLYHQAYVHLLGGPEAVIKLLPMKRGDILLGNQRFHLLEQDAAFRITAFSELSTGYESQLKRLLALSPLKAIHWINIGHERVTFITV